MWNWISNNSQLLIVLAFVGFSAFGGIVRWLQEQAAKNRKQAERRRRAEEALRTGRPAEDEAPAEKTATAGDPEESFAERRRRQIEELKRREAQARQRASSPQPTPVPRPAGADTPLPVPARRTEPAARPTPLGRPATQPAPARPEPGTTGASIGPAYVPAVRAVPTMGGQRAASASRSAATDRHARTGVQLAGNVLSRDELRRAIVLGELLAPPLSIRRQDERIL